MNAAPIPKSPAPDVESTLMMSSQSFSHRGDVVAPAGVVLPRTVKALVRQGAGLLVMMKQSGTWDLPGGKCDADEALEAALHRELLEETGVPARLVQYRHTIVRQRANRIGVAVSFYDVDLHPGWTTGDIRLSDEHSDLVIADSALLERLPMLDVYRQAGLDALRASV